MASVRQPDDDEVPSPVCLMAMLPRIDRCCAPRPRPAHAAARTLVTRIGGQGPVPSRAGGSRRRARASRGLLRPRAPPLGAIQEPAPSSATSMRCCRSRGTLSARRPAVSSIAAILRRLQAVVERVPHQVHGVAHASIIDCRAFIGTQSGPARLPCRLCRGRAPRG